MSSTIYCDSMVDVSTVVDDGSTTVVVVVVVGVVEAAVDCDVDVASVASTVVGSADEVGTYGASPG
jgi:hypothetical protein